MEKPQQRLTDHGLFWHNMECQTCLKLIFVGKKHCAPSLKVGVSTVSTVILYLINMAGYGEPCSLSLPLLESRCSFNHRVDECFCLSGPTAV